MTGPLDLAILHHRAMQDYVTKLRDNSNCIGQLVVGRVVKRRGDALHYLVTECRLGLGGVTGIYGKAKGSRATRPKHLGNVTEIAIVQPEEKP